MTITFRPAQQSDFPTIAGLLVQLYAVEIPGSLTGPLDRQQQLLLFSLQAKNNQGLQGRYVGCTTTGEIVATGVIERPDQQKYERAPSGTVRTSLALLGYRSTARLLLTVGRSMVGARPPDMKDAVYLHSVVVDAAYRGRGFGHALMTQLEENAAEHGYPAAYLQVLASNHSARRLYRQRGYQDIWSSPSWTRVLTWPSYIMRKAL